MSEQSKLGLSGAALALALGSALTLAAAPITAQAADGDKCFGIAMQGQNDCASGGGTSCSGSSKKDYQGDAWKLVPKGSCEKTASPTSPTGFGQLAAFVEKP